jgi:hypothetical protein
MDGILLAEHLLRIINERHTRIVEMITRGSLKNMEEYKQLVGSLESLDYIGDSLREILEKAD